MLPVVILQGPAKSGKDTVANFLVEDGGFVAIAQADPMKRLGLTCFGFTEAQLWGESRELKETPDLRFENDETWDWVLNRLDGAQGLACKGGRRGGLQESNGSEGIARRRCAVDATAIPVTAG